MEVSRTSSARDMRLANINGKSDKRIEVDPNIDQMARNLHEQI